MRLDPKVLNTIHVASEVVPGNIYPAQGGRKTPGTTYCPETTKGGLVITEDYIKREVQALRLDIAQALGTRLNRTQLASRLRIREATLQRWMLQDPKFPLPDRNGFWQLSKVIEWEMKQ